MIGRTIQLILAPVVMISACSIFVGGVLGHYTALNDGMRGLTRERLDLVRSLRAMRAGPSDDVRALALERVKEIDVQLPDLLRRHRLVHHAVLALYAAILVLIVTMCVIALTATVSADWVAALVIAFFVAGVLAMLVGVLLITVEIRTSQQTLSYEVQQVISLDPGSV
jgi:pilus assembly protein TadC